MSDRTPSFRRGDLAVTVQNGFPDTPSVAYLRESANRLAYWCTVWLAVAVSIFFVGRIFGVTVLPGIVPLVLYVTWAYRACSQYGVLARRSAVAWGIFGVVFGLPGVGICYIASLPTWAERRFALARFVMLLVLFGGAAAFLVPLYIMVVMSLKSATEIATSSPWLPPVHATWENYHTVLTNENAPFFAFFRNSTFIATVSTLGVVISSSLVAYPFARMRFRGRDRLFVLLLSTMMLPGIVTMISTFVLYKYLHWMDTPLPLTIPAWFGGGAFNIFLMRQFMMGLPRELDEAAFLDGASYSTIFWRVLLPNCGAALATIGIFAFVYTWKDFMGPLIYLSSPDQQTLEAGLRTYQSLNSEKWELLMTGAVLVMIPLIVMFFVGQRYFVKGIVMSGIK